MADLNRKEKESANLKMRKLKLSRLKSIVKKECRKKNLGTWGTPSNIPTCIPQ